MSDEPEVRWAPLPQKPKRHGAVWLIVGLGVLVVGIVIAFLLFVLPGGFKPEPGSSASPSASASSSSSPSAPSAEPTEPATPVTEAPAPVDPELDVFRERVSYLLDDAESGLGFVAESGGDEALSLVDLLLEDAQRLSDAVAPASMSSEWVSGVDAYASALHELRDDIAAGDPSDTKAASAGVEALRDFIGS